MPKSVAISARVSTDRQTTDSQLHELRQYVKRSKWKIYNKYIDHGYTGANTKRPAFTQMMTCTKKSLTYFLSGNSTASADLSKTSSPPQTNSAPWALTLSHTKTSSTPPPIKPNTQDTAYFAWRSISSFSFNLLLSFVSKEAMEEPLTCFFVQLNNVFVQLSISSKTKKAIALD